MNLKEDYYAIGIMSGSSLDGLDIVYCKFQKKKRWTFEILGQDVVSIKDWGIKLKNSRSLPPTKLDVLDKAFGVFIGKSVQNFIQEKNITQLDIIASHGHTVYHFPEKGITKQIGFGEEIFKQTKKAILTNLRQKDIDLGGNGAPIVPIGDLHLFSEYKYCLNIGGIANISIKNVENIIAFDICTANQVLNYLANKKALSYDDRGNLARQGKLNIALLNKLNKIDFYKQAAPKSLDNSFREIAIGFIDEFEISIEDKLCTYCHHIAFQIKSAIQVKEKTPKNILITGGGALNIFLVETISIYLKEKNIEVVIPSKEIIDNKEALIMAFMGVLYLRNEINCLASATGAKQDSICGEYYFG
ncbi:MAG: anhydro-N-acetylmuramic acid kinase [Chitinophagales bacterium]